MANQHLSFFEADPFSLASNTDQALTIIIARAEHSTLCERRRINLLYMCCCNEPNGTEFFNVSIASAPWPPGRFRWTRSAWRAGGRAPRAQSGRGRAPRGGRAAPPQTPRFGWVWGGGGDFQGSARGGSRRLKRQDARWRDMRTTESRSETAHSCPGTLCLQACPDNANMSKRLPIYKGRGK